MNKALKIGHFPIIDHLILGVALHNDAGSFEHLEIETKFFTNWPSMMKALEEGEIDGTFLLFPLAFELFRKGSDIKLLLLGHREGQIIVAKNEIKSVADLKGRRVHVPDVYSTHNILLHMALQQAGLSDEDVILSTGFDDPRDMVRMLEKDEVDAFVSAEPMGTNTEQRGIGHILQLSHDIGSHHADCVLVLREEAIEKNEKGVQELVESLVKAGLFINAYPRQASEIGEDFLGWQRKILLRSLTHDKGHILFWDLLPRVEDFTEMQRVAVEEMGLWKEPIDLSKLIDASFAQAAYREWVIDTRRNVKDRGEERTLPGGFAEGAKRFRAFFRGAADVAGLKKISAGEKYPAEAKKLQKISGEVSDFLEDVFQGKQYVLETDLADVKGLAFVPSESGTEPERVIFRLSQSEALKALQALHWGDKIAEVAEYKEEIAERQLFSSADNISVVQKGDDVYFSVDFTVFRFLVLLLHHV